MDSTYKQWYDLNMKKTNKSLLFIIPLMITLGGFSQSQNQPSKVDAYHHYTKSEMPTDINLNDCEEIDIRNYYSSLNSKSTSELKGNNLLKNLKPILSNGQKYFQYTSDETIWRAYEITDRDWVLSPASEITGYNASTNTISNYNYKASTSFSDPKNPYIHALYVDRTKQNPMKAWGNHSQTSGGINREHIWAKSHGFNDENATSGGGKGGARGDLMHLWPGDGKTNNLHSNYFYGYVDRTKTNKLSIPELDYAKNNALGISKTLGGNKKVFEPQDSDKGDVARAIFYMAARYNNFAGATSGFDTNEPNLLLVNDATTTEISGYESTATNPGTYGVISDLLEWNKLDPVDEYEIHRNNILYRNYTCNRNPFVDFPSWADLIWGDSEKSANPASDSINRIQVGGPHDLDFIEITGTYTTSFTYGSTFSREGLKVYAHNNDGETYEVTDACTFSTPNMSSVGQQKITVSYEGVTTEYTITITDVLDSITVSGNYKTNYQIGDSISYANLVVTAHYLSGATSVIPTSSCTFSTVDLTTTGDKTITVTYEGKTVDFVITVNEISAVLERIEISGDYTNQFLYGSQYNRNGLVVTAYYSDNSSEDVTDSCTFDSVNTSSLGTQSISVSYNGKFAYYDVIIYDEVSGIEISGNFKTNYVVGDEISLNNVLVKVNYVSGATANLSGSACSMYPVDMSEPGEKLVTLSYFGKTDSFTIYVEVDPVEDFFDKLGCGGSIISSSILVSAFAILGALFLKKRKEN